MSSSAVLTELLAESPAMIHYPNSAPLLAGIMATPGGDFIVRRAKPVRAMDQETLLVGSVDG